MVINLKDKSKLVFISQTLDRKEYDDERTLYLKSMGYSVIRFWNDEIFNNIDSVRIVINESCSKKIKPSP